MNQKQHLVKTIFLKGGKLKNRVLPILIILLLGVSIDLSAQKRKHRAPRNPQKEAAKKKREKKEAYKVAVDKGQKRHRKMQEKPVQKRMRKSLKKANRYDTGKRDPFLKRLFTRKKIRR